MAKKKILFKSYVKWIIFMEYSVRALLSMSLYYIILLNPNILQFKLAAS